MQSRSPGADRGFPVEVFRSSALCGGTAGSRRLNYVYVQNWKCASSTIRTTLWAAEHAIGTAPGPPGPPHGRSAEAPFADDPRRWERVEDDFVFTFVRNPYARVLSAYLNKIHLHRDPEVWGAFARRHRLGEAPLAFGDFLRVVAGEPPEQLDPHWRPQTCGLVPRLIPYHLIGSIEDFDTDMAEALRRIFGDALAPVHSYVPHRTGAASRLAEHYGPAEVELVQRIYRQDFLELGYGPDLEDQSRCRPTQRPDPRPVQAWGRAWRLIEAKAYREAERELIGIRPWMAGPAIEEKLLRCRYEQARSAHDRSPDLRASVRGIEQSLARGHGSWITWKWYGKALLLLGRREDGLEALLRAMEGRGPHAATEKRVRRLSYRLAILRASKGRRGEAVAALPTTAPEVDGAGRRALPRLRAAVGRSALQILALAAAAVGAGRWHPDRALGIPAAPGNTPVHRAA